jgi:hypothetical protein
MATEKNNIENYTEWFLEELKEYGYIKGYLREPEQLIASAPIKYGRYKRFKRKDKIVEDFNLFPEIKYTYDYRIIWESKAEYLFYEEVNENRIFQFGKPLFVAHKEVINDVLEIVSIIDVKPTTSVMQKGGKVSSSVSFPFKQRLVWETFNVYVTKVVPIPMAGTGYSSALFIIAFTPMRYLFTDGGGMERKIKFPVKGIKQYVSEKAASIKEIINTTL